MQCQINLIKKTLVWFSTVGSNLISTDCVIFAVKSSFPQLGAAYGAKPHSRPKILGEKKPKKTYSWFRLAASDQIKC